MRAAPVNLPAMQTAAELGLGLARMRRQEVRNLGFRYLTEGSIAVHATGKGYEMGMQGKPASNFAQLIMRLVRTYTIARCNLAPFEEAHIPSKQTTVFAAGHGGEQRIIRKTVIPRVEPEHSKKRSKPAQVPIGHKARLLEMYRRHMRKYLDAVSLHKPLRGGACPAIHHHPLKLCVRDSQRLDDVLNGIGFAGGMLEFDVPVCGTQKIVELPVKAEPYANTAH